MVKVELRLLLGLGFVLGGQEAKAWLEWGCEGVPKGSVGCTGPWAVRNFLVGVLQLSWLGLGKKNPNR